MVITDIDGTLLDDEGNLPDLNRRALAHCKATGVYTCLATGRRWTTCLRLIERLQLDGLVDFCILNNGMIVREIAGNQTLFRRDFPFSTMMEAVERLNAIDIDPIVLGHNPDGKTRDVFHRGDSLMNGDFVAKNTLHSLRVSEWEELREAHLVELVLIGYRKDLQAAADALAGLDVEIVILRNSFYAEYMLEVTPRHVSKLLGARDLLGHLGLGFDQALAVGDSDNDYALLEHIPMSIAVSNADARVLGIVREVTGSNAQGGFGQSVFKHIPALGLGPGTAQF